LVTRPINAPVTHGHRIGSQQAEQLAFFDLLVGVSQGDQFPAYSFLIFAAADSIITPKASVSIAGAVIRSPLP
jgi:hypothetical protein